jgi:hypothetical protein
MAGSWRRLHNEELHAFYMSPNISIVMKSRMRLTKHVACMGEIRNMYKILFGKPEGMRPLKRHRCTCEDNNRMDFREMGWEGVDRFIWLRIGTNGGLL